MILPFHSDDEVRAAAPKVAQHLAAGRLLAYPTETVYGLGSRAVQADVRTLARLKGRKEGKAFLLLVANRAMAEAQGLRFTRSAQALSDQFWPGALTLVLSGGEGRLPDTLRGPEGGIAVRWTSHPGMARLITILGFPVTSTSANRPGEPTAPGPTAIVDQFGADVESGALLVLDGGTLGNLPPSTVIDCTESVPRVIREGAIPVEELRAAVGSLAP
ncbi:MAG: L-threonylcarbamoyladenylate synthase [Gemmatimonadales bacterium]|nr:L-threonylcarbamoyladenylate synthase [Gemmatimonadales bacterium]